MTLENIVELETKFSDIVFYDHDHSYRINGEPIGQSVSRVIKKYETPFDKDKLSQIVAKRQGILVEDVIQLWDFKREYACEKGTLIHGYIENFLFRKRVPLDKGVINRFVKKYPEYVTEEVFYEDMARYVKNFSDFYNWWKQEHVLVKSELVVGDKESTICGTMDNLSYNFKENYFCIFDYKSNKEMKDKSKDMLKGLVGHLGNTSTVKYSLQTHLYKALLERNTNIKIKKCLIVWIGGDNYELIPALDVEKEAQSIIKAHIFSK